MSDQTGFMDIDGIHLEYAWHGPPPDQKPTIVMLHEGLGCMAGWLDFPQRLSKATGCGVLVYSRQGYGGSDPVPRPLTHMHDEARNVLPKVIDQWGLLKVFLVGHSDGASIAAIYAGSILDHRVRGIVLMTPHFFNEEVCIKGVLTAKQAFEEGPLRDNLARYHGDNVDLAFYGWSTTWLHPDFAGWSIEEELTYIRVPVLLIWCVNDRYASLDQVARTSDACTCPLEVVLLDKAIHWPFREEPENTLLSVEQFIKRMIEVHGETVPGRSS